MTGIRRFIGPVFLLALAACNSGGSDATTANSSVAFGLVNKITLTADTENGLARPEITTTADRVFIVYLGNIGGGGGRTFKVKIFNSTLDAVMLTRTLTETTAQYGGPTDIRIASDGQYLYAFYETNKTVSANPPSSVTSLWGAKYQLNDDFTLVASTTTPITSSKPVGEIQDGEELLDDPAPLIGPDSLFVVTRLKYSLSTAGKTVYRVREFSKDAFALMGIFDLDLSCVAAGRGRVTSLLYRTGNYYMALATTVSDTGPVQTNDDGAPSDILLVKMRPDWTFDPQTDVLTLSSEPDDRENYITGLRTDGTHFFLAYKQAVGSPPTGEQRAVIKIFDMDFNLLHKEIVKRVPWGPEGGEIRPSIEAVGDRLYSGQSAGQGIGTGNAEVYVYVLRWRLGSSLFFTLRSILQISQGEVILPLRS